MKNNEFLDLVSSPLMNLDHTYRYSGTKLVERESLSQHIVDTIMLGLRIIDKINSISGEKILDTETYVMKSIYHDLEEVITGDIPRPLKYYDNDTLGSMRNVANKIAIRLFVDQFEQSRVPYEIWRDAKDGDEGFILKLVDTLVVANKVIKEVSLLNNYYMLRVAHEVVQYLRHISDVDHFDNVDVNFYLSCVVQGAIKSMEDILEDHKDVIEKINVYSQSII